MEASLGLCYGQAVCVRGKKWKVINIEASVESWNESTSY